MKKTKWSKTKTKNLGIRIGALMMDAYGMEEGFKMYQKLIEPKIIKFFKANS